MTRTFCDRCDSDTTGKKSGHVMGIPDADEQGNGDVQQTADLCETCYLALLAWLKQPPPSVMRKRALQRADEPNT